MPKVTEEHREAMRERIRTAALAAVARKGIRSTSMADILREGGFSAGAFYGYFDSKDDLLIDTASRLVGAKRERLRAMRTADPLPHPAEFVAFLFDDLPEQLVTSGLLLQVWGEARSVPELREAAVAAMNEVRGEIEAHLTDWFAAQDAHDPGGTGAARGTPAERAARLAPALVGLAQGHLVHGALRSEADRRAYVASVHDLLSLL